MNKTTEALKLAAKALSGDYAVHPDEALAAIREVLAEHPMDYDQGFVDGVEAQLAEPVKPSQLADASLEPVAWMDSHGNVKNNEEINDYITAGWGKDKVATYSIPLYAAPVQPVKQEPVAYTNKEQLEYLKDPRYSNMPMAMWSKPFFESMNVELYAAPVDAKAIRAEVLEEAANVCEERLQIPMLDAAHTMEIQLCAAAIRGLK